MITVEFQCDKYGDHTAQENNLEDVQTKRFEEDEEFEAAAFVDECTLYPIVKSDVDLMGILQIKQAQEVDQLQYELFGEE